MPWFLENLMSRDWNINCIRACNRFMDSRRQTTIVDSGSVLVLQLLHYDNIKGAAIKNNMKVNCLSETLRPPISPEEQVCLYKQFTLKATSTTLELCKLAIIGAISRMKITVAG